MGAEFRGEIDVFRLVEASDEVTCFEHRAQHRRRVPRIGAEIPVAQIMGGKERRTAREIKNEIATRGRAIAGSFEDQGSARGGAESRVIVGDELESAEIALGVADRS